MTIGDFHPIRFAAMSAAPRAKMTLLFDNVLTVIFIDQTELIDHAFIVKGTTVTSLLYHIGNYHNVRDINDSIGISATWW